MDKELERFWGKVDKSENCWNWTAGTNTWGYGQFWASGRIIRAHRYSWQLVHGPVDRSVDIDHICRNRICVNPEHLRTTTRKQNNENRSGKSSRTESGIRGVYRRNPESKWQGKVVHNGYAHYVGSFDDLAEAEAAVIAKRNELYTHNDEDRRAA